MLRAAGTTHRSVPYSGKIRLQADRLGGVTGCSDAMPQTYTGTSAAMGLRTCFIDSETVSVFAGTLGESLLCVEHQFESAHWAGKE
jgi:hypothetical protein